MNVELITSGLFHWSVGDAALLHATQLGLAARGIMAIPRSVPTPGATCVVGGGQLLDPHIEWSRIRGPHLLSAAGVNEGTDTGYLREYRYVSVRDFASANRIERSDVHLTSCPSSLLERPNITWLQDEWEYRNIPLYGYRLFENHDLAIATDDDVIFEPRPWKGSLYRGPGFRFPPTTCVDACLECISRARVVVCCSLHLGILALAMGVPFACCRIGDEHQDEKVRGYWARAGRDDIQHATPQAALERSESWTDLDSLRGTERRAASAHLDRIAAALQC